MNGSDSNIARDAYSSNDPYSSRDAHASHDPYATKNPYDSDSSQNNKDEKEPSIYGYGTYCDQFFILENLFRTKFTDDTQLHSEKRDYVGSGDLASIFPKMSRMIGASFSLLILFIVTASFVLFLSDSFILNIAVIVVFAFLYIWRFFCPSYLIYNAKQYIIGDEYKNLYRGFVGAIKFVEISNIILLTFLYFFSTMQQNTIILLFKTGINFLYEKSPILKDFLYELSQKTLDFSNFREMLYVYFVLIVLYYLFFYYFKNKVVAKKHLNNLKDVKMKRLANIYQRKAFILNGENF